MGKKHEDNLRSSMKGDVAGAAIHLRLANAQQNLVINVPTDQLEEEQSCHSATVNHLEEELFQATIIQQKILDAFHSESCK